ncbi:MAG: hypothetical protein ACRDRS_26265 [Pseudonocardiaceae bacterium]
MSRDLAQWPAVIRPLTLVVHAARDSDDRHLSARLLRCPAPAQQPATAVDLLTTAAARRDTTHARSRAFDAVAPARALFVVGDIDAARDAGHRALSVGTAVDSARVRRRVLDLAHDTAPPDTVPAPREQLLATTSARNPGTDVAHARCPTPGGTTLRQQGYTPGGDVERLVLVGVGGPLVLCSGALVAGGGLRGVGRGDARRSAHRGGASGDEPGRPIPVRSRAVGCSAAG